MNLVPCPQHLLDRLQKTKEELVIVYDKTYSEYDDDGYKIYHKEKWRKRQQCDGHDPDRYSVVAAAINLQEPR